MHILVTIMIGQNMGLSHKNGCEVYQAGKYCYLKSMVKVGLAEIRQQSAE